MGSLDYAFKVSSAYEITDPEFNLVRGVYICGLCKREFPMTIYKGRNRRTISTENNGAAKANFHRHIIACANIGKKLNK